MGIEHIGHCDVCPATVTLRDDQVIPGGWAEIEIQVDDRHMKVLTCDKCRPKATGLFNPAITVANAVKDTLRAARKQREELEASKKKKK